MWTKVITGPFQTVIKTALSNPELSRNGCITWKTKNGILHLCSFITMNQVSDTIVEEGLQFTIWENK